VDHVHLSSELTKLDQAELPDSKETLDLRTIKRGQILVLDFEEEKRLVLKVVNPAHWKFQQNALFVILSTNFDVDMIPVVRNAFQAGQYLGILGGCTHDPRSGTGVSAVSQGKVNRGRHLFFWYEARSLCFALRVEKFELKEAEQ
jgi:hypothetical protein